MIIQHNMRAMNANRQLNITSGEQAKSTEKLSSGYRINRAADDAAGLSISEKMRAQVRGLTQDSRNAQDGISMVQTAEGALGEVTAMLQRMNELSVQAATGTVNTQQKGYLDKEVSALKKEIDRIGTDTTFNGLKLFQSTSTTQFFVGAEETSTSITTAGIKLTAAGALGTDGLGLTGDLTTASKAKAFLGQIQLALESVSGNRSDYGAVQNRLEYTIKNLDNVAENTQAAEARVRDTNMATEMVKYSNNNILAQAGQSMLAQANQSNQGVLSLLQG